MKEVVLTALIRLSSLIETASGSFWVTLWKPMSGALSQNMRKKLLSMSFRISMSSKTSQTRLAFVSSFRSFAILKKSWVPSAKSARPHPTAQPTFWRKKRRHMNHMNSEIKWKGDKTESKVKWTWLQDEMKLKFESEHEMLLNPKLLECVQNEWKINWNMTWEKHWNEVNMTEKEIEKEVRINWTWNEHDLINWKWSGHQITVKWIWNIWNSRAAKVSHIEKELLWALAAVQVILLLWSSAQLLTNCRIFGPKNLNQLIFFVQKGQNDVFKEASQIL